MRLSINKITFDRVTTGAQDRLYFRKTQFWLQRFYPKGSDGNSKSKTFKRFEFNNGSPKEGQSTTVVELSPFTINKGGEYGTNFSEDYIIMHVNKVVSSTIDRSKYYKTSADWQEEAKGLRVMDPDGWNRKNYQFSFYQEKITRFEFMNRVLRSTCTWTNMDVFSSYPWS